MPGARARPCSAGRRVEERHPRSRRRAMVSMSGWCASISRASGVAWGPPTTTCAFGSQALDARARRAPPRGGSPSSTTCRRGRRRASRSTCSTCAHGKAERLITLTWCPARSACAPEGEEAVRRLEEVGVEIARGVLGGRPVAAHIGAPHPAAGSSRGAGRARRCASGPRSSLL